jgi:hypothetical protein
MDDSGNLMMENKRSEIIATLQKLLWRPGDLAFEPERNCSNLACSDR